VTGVPGIVTGVRGTGDSRGYWIQDPTPDTNAATSEGIFVYTASAAITVAAGDSVLVAGRVSEFYPGGAPATNSALSVTEIAQTGVTILGHGATLPSPQVIGPKTVPALYAPYIGGNIESTPVTPTRSALDFWEAREGMRVEVDNVRVIGPTNSFGELYVTTKPTENRTYRGGSTITGYNTAPAGRLEVVAASGSSPVVNVGDVLSGATVGPVDYSDFGGYLIAATTIGAGQDNHLVPTVATRQRPNQLAVATYNVENLAPVDPDAKYARLAQGVVTNLAAPDILTVEEVQDNTGATDDGVVAADQTLAKLTGAILAAGGPHYAWQSVDPTNDADGGQPGGNIRVVFLYNPDRVSFVQTGRADATTATQIVKYAGQPHLSLSPGRIDPTSTAWTDSRKPLVGEFLFHGETVFVIGNHFISKGGDQNADGRFQPAARSSEIQRQQQATEVHDFVAGLLKVDKKAKVVVAGDLNDYQFSPTLQVLKTGTAAATGKPILTDLITTLPANRQYTYVFDGVSQVLDHILVTSGVGAVSYEVIHLNAEFADQVSDHDPQVVRFTV
jgi:predicted extracellular nuclease